jgi:tetratricopeptide (TPR) repeat protein
VAQTDRVYELISSLSRGEKLNFKKSAAKHIIGNSGNGYTRLFDRINLQTKNGKYSESDIRNYFSSESFIKNLSVMKAYLYECILKELSPPAGQSKSWEYLSHANKLLSKGLYWRFTEMITKAKKTAAEDEEMNALLCVHEAEFNYGTKYIIENQKKRLKEILREESVTLKKISNLHQYRHRLLEIPFFSSMEVLIRDNRLKNKIKKMLKSDPFLSSDRSASFRAKFLYLMIKAMCYYSMGDFLKAFNYYEKLLGVIESSPALQKVVTNHTLVYYNYIYNAMLLKKFDKAKQQIGGFEKLLLKKGSKLNRSAKIICYASYYLCRLDLIILKADEQEGAKTLAEAEKFILSCGSVKNHNVLHLMFTISIAYFASGNYHRALHWINRYINENNEYELGDFAIGVKILGIFIHYELKNFELLPYYVKSLYRFLLRKKKAYRFEVIIIKFIRKLSSVKTNEDFIFSLKHLKKELEALKSDPFEARIFREYFDYISWIESKIENKPVGEIIRSKL